MPPTSATTGSAPVTLLDNPEGSYRILPGGVAYCTGIVPLPGYEVVRVQLRTWLPLDRAYPFIAAFLAGEGRPVQAFCGIEMRVPAPLTFDDWARFNGPYLAQLRQWGLLHGDLSGVCRSNIALAEHAPQTASMCAFSYTAPAAAGAGGFCLSGTADITRTAGSSLPATQARRPCRNGRGTRSTPSVAASRGWACPGNT